MGSRARSLRERRGRPLAGGLLVLRVPRRGLRPACVFRGAIGRFEQVVGELGGARRLLPIELRAAEVSVGGGGSLPLNAPPPCRPMPPYVSTMIFLPVSPQSPKGPPITKRPVGLTKNLVLLSMSFLGMTFSITRSMTASLSVLYLTSGECWVETTIASQRTGASFSYSMVTCVLPSGLRKSALPDFRTSARRLASR